MNSNLVAIQKKSMNYIIYISLDLLEGVGKIYVQFFFYVKTFNDPFNSFFILWILIKSFISYMIHVVGE